MIGVYEEYGGAPRCAAYDVVLAIEGESWFEGRPVDEVQRTYPGYPLADDEVADGLRSREDELRSREETP